MAQRLNPESGNDQHNAHARAGQIRSTFKEMADLDDQIDTLIERHVKPLKDKQKKLRRNLKKDLDVPIKVINAQYKTYKMAHDTTSYEDEDEGDKILDALHEFHDALHPGGQVDWIAAINDVRPAPQFEDDENAAANDAEEESSEAAE